MLVKAAKCQCFCSYCDHKQPRGVPLTVTLLFLEEDLQDWYEKCSKYLSDGVTQICFKLIFELEAEPAEMIEF